MLQNDSDSLVNMGTSHENYYPTVAINALMKILNDSSLSMHHQMGTSSQHAHITALVFHIAPTHNAPCCLLCWLAPLGGIHSGGFTRAQP